MSERKPLTPEEEAQVRRRCDGLSVSAADVLALLATLDDCRAQLRAALRERDDNARGCDRFAAQRDAALAREVKLREVLEDIGECRPAALATLSYDDGDILVGDRVREVLSQTKVKP